MDRENYLANDKSRGLEKQRIEASRTSVLILIELSLHCYNKIWSLSQEKRDWEA